MKLGDIVKPKEDMRPLYKKGDRFKIIELNEGTYLMPIRAKMLKRDLIVGFDYHEIESEETKMQSNKQD